MSGSTRASVQMFREPGYAWISDQVQALLDKAGRAVEDVDDPVAVALSMATVAELVAQQLRDLGADVYLERAS